MPKLFSILHPTARPEKWRAVYDAWLDAAVDKECFEYILCVDTRWGFPSKADFEKRFPLTCTPPELLPFAEGNVSPLTVVWNEGRRCYVDAVNTAANVSTGDILIVIADDQFPCEAWDVKLLQAIAEDRKCLSLRSSHRAMQFVVEVDTGTPNEHERKIMPMPILSRGHYDSLGHVFFPKYESMFADNDFCEQARFTGVVIDARKRLATFPHRHALFEGRELDAQYQAQMSRQAWDLGKRLLDARRAANFADVAVPTPKKIAIMAAKEDIEWTIALMNTREYLRSKFDQVEMVSGYTSNVYVTRIGNTRELLEAAPDAQYVLMIDDDNIVEPQHVARLLDAAEKHPEFAAIFAWCWIVHPGEDQVWVSCGMMGANGQETFDPIQFPRKRGLQEIDWSGLPCALVRMDLLRELGAESFLPILDSRARFGVVGEDIAFCRRAREKGYRLAVDPGCEVDHVKPRRIRPVFPEGKLPTPKVSAMLRVKNEARWIGNVIDSLKPLCEDRIFVLDDVSWDGTAAIAADRGATVCPTPYAGRIDEARDKAYMTRQVKTLWPDTEWIICVDGDEQLEPLGAEKIFATLRNPRYDNYALRFVDLWDRIDQARVDRWYSEHRRNSIFRADLDAEFKSSYEGTGAHAGLHVSNAPAGAPWAVIDAYLIHYGPLHKEDRIRKWKWYNYIDPNNQIEDCYRHIVQGDVPEVPADAVLQHAGPLQLRKLPASLVPKFPGGVVPGPLEAAEAFRP